MNKIIYGEGTVFKVPLKTKGFARGVIARGDKKTCLFGYFFGPVLLDGSTMQIGGLIAECAIYKARFGDLGLRKGEWPIIGKLPDWNRERWPMPDFVRRDPLGVLKPMLIRYCDKNPSKEVMAHVIDDGSDLLRASLAGSDFVEIILTKLLDAEASF